MFYYACPMNYTKVQQHTIEALVNCQCFFEEQEVDHIERLCYCYMLPGIKSAKEKKNATDAGKLNQETIENHKMEHIL